jgi:hypothetical protein
MDLKGLTKDELADLYMEVVTQRKLVNELVDKFGYSASQLVSRTFEQDIEKEFGRKTLKELTKIELELKSADKGSEKSA